MAKTDEKVQTKLYCGLGGIMLNNKTTDDSKHSQIIQIMMSIEEVC